MKVSVVSYSLSHDPMTLLDWKSKLLSEIRTLVDQGAEVIVYPELFLMGLSRYTDAKTHLEELEKTAHLIDTDILPFLKSGLSAWTTIILGSGPRIINGRIYNSSPIFHKGEWLFQDKLFLTPWETDFTAGEELFVFNLRGLKTCVVICFDSEQPDLAVKLKETQIDFMIVLSATMNRNGSQRVNRCASSRSVELGAAVITCPLIGDCGVEIVDHNEGRAGMFLPAQESITEEQEQFAPYTTADHLVNEFSFDPQKILELKNPSSETKPFLKPIQNNIRITMV